MPYELERLHTPLEGYVTLSELYLKFGVRFPLHPFFVEVLRYFGLTIFQITPNGWADMIRLFGLCMEHRMGPPIVAEFTWFYSLKGNKNDEGFYCFAKRPGKGMQAIIKIKDNLGPGMNHTSTLRRSKSEVPLAGHVSSPLGSPFELTCFCRSRLANT